MKWNPSRFGISEIQRKKLSSFRDRYKNERVFIIGNGPSLNKHDLSLLKNEYSFGVNSIFLKTDATGFVPSFYVVEDSHVIDDNLERIIEYKVPYKFFLARYSDKIPETENVYFMDSDLGFYRGDHPFRSIPRFSRNASEVVFAGQSVTMISLQLAYFMGFSEFYLIGMDFNYVKPDSIIENGKTWISTEDDPNHFDPSYFGAGKKWHDPQLDGVRLNYEYVQKVFELSGRTIKNATIGGKLEIFERVDYYSLFE